MIPEHPKGRRGQECGCWDGKRRAALAPTVSTQSGPAGVTGVASSVESGVQVTPWQTPKPYGAPFPVPPHSPWAPLGPHTSKLTVLVFGAWLVSTCDTSSCHCKGLCLHNFGSSGTCLLFTMGREGVPAGLPSVSLESEVGAEMLVERRGGCSHRREAGRRARPLLSPRGCVSLNPAWTWEVWALN